MIARTSPDSGFTLIELLVVAALTAILAGMLATGISSLHTFWHRAQNGYVKEEAEAGVQRLREMLITTQSAYANDGLNRTARLVFHGRLAELTFVTLSEGFAFQGGLLRVRIYSEKGENGLRVLARAAVFRSDRTELNDLPPSVLFDDVANFRLRYFGRDKLGVDPSWHVQWLGKQILPLFVEVEVSFHDAGKLRRITVPVELRHASNL